MTGEDKLSPRELQVIQLVAAGFDNKEIAEKLKISVSTIKGHLQSIFRRLRVSTRNEAVARAFQDGWISFSRQSRVGITSCDRSPALHS